MAEDPIPAPLPLEERLRNEAATWRRRIAAKVDRFIEGVKRAAEPDGGIDPIFNNVREFNIERYIRDLFRVIQSQIWDREDAADALASSRLALQRVEEEHAAREHQLFKEGKQAMAEADRWRKNWLACTVEKRAEHELRLADNRALRMEAATLMQERNKWVDTFNRSEQFQSGPTKRAEQAEAALALAREERDKALAEVARLQCPGCIDAEILLTEARAEQQRLRESLERLASDMEGRRCVELSATDAHVRTIDVPAHEFNGWLTRLRALLLPRDAGGTS